MGPAEVEPEAGIQEPWSVEAVLSGEAGQGEMLSKAMGSAGGLLQPHSVG